MAADDVVGELRSVIADALHRLNADRGGHYMSSVASALAVERSTVSRWQKRTVTAKPEHCEMLATHWPDYFDGARLAELHYRAVQIGPHVGATSVGIEMFDSPAGVYSAATEALRMPQPRLADRVYRHVAFHLDRRGTDPMEADLLFDEGARQATQVHRALMAQRAAEGWQMHVVLSAGNPSRLGSIAAMMETLEGPNVEIFAYPYRLPMVLAPVIIANQVVLLSHDHRRWERPDSAILIRSRTVADWASKFFVDLVADAPIRLRTPSGADQIEFNRLKRYLDDHP